MSLETTASREQKQGKAFTESKLSVLRETNKAVNSDFRHRHQPNSHQNL